MCHYNDVFIGAEILNLGLHAFVESILPSEWRI